MGVRCCHRNRTVLGAVVACALGGAVPAALAQFTADGRLDEEVLLVQTVLDGRVGYAAFVVDTSPEGENPGADGFRDGPPSPTVIPECAICVDAASTRARTPFNTGKLTVIYLMDSDGLVDHTDPGSDDSVLYVGMDIANGDPRTVGGHDIDVENLNHFSADPSLCDDGVPDLNGDGQANTYMIPFDVDGDGDCATVTRFTEEGDPNCIIEINDATGDLTAETYELEVYACVSDRDAKMTGDRLFMFRLTMEEGPGVDTIALRMFKDLDHPCTDFSAAEVTGSHEGLSCDQLTALGQDPNFGRDIEFLIKRVDSLVITAYGTPPDCVVFPDYRDVRFKLAEGGVKTLSGASGDLSVTDVIEAPFVVEAPEIEVTKKVLRVADAEAVAVIVAVPGSTVEFVIDIENTGNVDLGVTLTDVLETFGGTNFTVDETYLNATLYRPADGTGIIEPITFYNAGSFGLNEAFFVPGGSGSPGFLGGIIDGEQRYLGVLQAVTPCAAMIPGDKLELVFRATAESSNECIDQINPDICNTITATGDPDIPPVADGDEVTDAAGSVPLDQVNGVDTFREKNVNAPASDDNVVFVNVRCPGDLDCDGSVNLFDVDPFVLVLVSDPPYDEYYSQYPDCDIGLADINADGSVNLFDIDPFVELLAGG